MSEVAGECAPRPGSQEVQQRFACAIQSLGDRCFDSAPICSRVEACHVGDLRERAGELAFQTSNAVFLLYRWPWDDGTTPRPNEFRQSVRHLVIVESEVVPELVDNSFAYFLHGLMPRTGYAIDRATEQGDLTR